jgi:proline racemase
VSAPRKVVVIDSHTAGERTRLVIGGAPDIGRGSMADRLAAFRARHDRFRSAVVNEPRGSDDLVGALLIEPSGPRFAAGLIFFNNVGYLGMCGHGLIGVVRSLQHLGRLGPGAHRFETPVGEVRAELEPDGMVSIENVTSWREAKDVAVDIPGIGLASGDVAWGGNWFFLVDGHGIEVEIANLECLQRYSFRLRQALNAQGFPQVDHVELFAPPRRAGAHSRNFVLCPGNAYDRSPCGTGTSAKLACLAAEGKLAEGETWVQESVIGSAFSARYRWVDRDAGTILPTISGTAHVTAETTLILDEADPFCWGIGRSP